MNDAVLTYHENPLTCGVAKFNHALAQRLGIPCESLLTADRICPLVSVKPSEIPEGLCEHPMGTYDLFLHDYRDTERERRWVDRARKVYAANESIWLALRPLRPDVILAWCPSLIRGQAMTGRFRVLLFGMAHKRQMDKLKKLRKLLDHLGYDYTVEVSTGIHEGSPWDEAWQEAQADLSSLFGHHLRLLGYLADDALAERLTQVHLAALFFEKGVRANNTTVWAALDAGIPVLTNLDPESPQELVHRETVLDLGQTRSLLNQPLDRIAKAGQVAAQARSWPRLLSVLVA